MSNPLDQPNPYVSPQAGSWGTPTMPAAPPSHPMPTFCKVMFWVDIVFSAIRIPAVAVGILAYSIAQPHANAMVAQTGIFEIASAMGMVLFGFTGDIAMLLKQKWGVYLGGLKVASVLASCAVGIWQATFVMEQFASGSPNRVGVVIGAAFSVGLRLALVAAYAAAIVQFAKWCNSRTAAS